MKKLNQLSNEELASFCSQTAILLHAGIAPIEGLRILLSDTTDKKSCELLTNIIDDISDGNSFAGALSDAGVFPDYMLNTIKLGEEAGSLDDVMQSLANYYEREALISDSIKSAITYPLVMIAMMVIVIIMLITKVLPIFNQVFIQLGSEMTGFASSLMSIGESLNSYSIVFIAILLLLIALYFFFARTTIGKNLLQKIAANFFLTRRFYEGIAIGRFAGGMALALSAGLDTYAGLELVKKIVEHKKVQAKIDVCIEVLGRGDSFAEALKEAGLFSNVNNRMISVGFKSGEIDKIMRKIADQYEAQSERRISEIISVIEPTLVIVLSIIVGLILLSVILPLMGIMSTIG